MQFWNLGKDYSVDNGRLRLEHIRGALDSPFEEWPTVYRYSSTSNPNLEKCDIRPNEPTSPNEKAHPTPSREKGAPSAQAAPRTAEAPAAPPPPISETPINVTGTPEPSAVPVDTQPLPVSITDTAPTSTPQAKDDAPPVIDTLQSSQPRQPPERQEDS